LNRIIVKKIEPGSLKANLSLFQFDSLYETHDLLFEPWTYSTETTRVTFKAAHDTSSLFLEFLVHEEFTRAVNTRDGSPVYEDSCVEFFVRLDAESYYNFEFNAIGTCLAEIGSGRKGRKKLPPEFLKNIHRHSTLGRDPIINSIKKGNWKLAVSIPLATLFNRSLAGLRTWGNFYKCGSNLPTPHYITWSKVESEKPDFHRPEFFGEIEFE